jgi:maltooligosyltrehalose trehalohydrolase
MTYRFVIDDGTEVPDPASRFQPEDVDGPSEIIDPLAFGWTDLGWRGRPWHEQIVYELHVGTFTPEGTFRAIIDKLDYLVDLGITTIELLPIAEFRGRWNWGYDGSQLFAPDASYGRPEDLKALVDAAHAKGLSVFLDVVYNHFGPKGNYLPGYAPLFTEKHHTPWGAGINLDAAGSATVRELFFANARFWLNEYHLDGLRFDAVHEIHDDSDQHMLAEMAGQIRAATDGRHIHIVVENSDNEAKWLKRRDDGAPQLYDAQWSDDIHHALHALLTSENVWYYADFEGRTDIAGRALAEGFGWQGEYLEHEKRHKGEPSAFLPPTAFMSYMQNHDQAGNRPFGERIGHLTSTKVLRVWAAIYLLSPQIPMLFMGEEWNAKEPFLFFSDLGEDLAEPIRQGRLKELEHYPDDHRGTPPDPMAQSTFESCKLDWSWKDDPAQVQLQGLYRHLIALRKKEITPRLLDSPGNSGRYRVLGDRVLRVEWTLGDGSLLALTANLSGEPINGLELWDDNHLWLEGEATGSTLGAYSCVFNLKRH